MNKFFLALLYIPYIVHASDQKNALAFYLNNLSPAGIYNASSSSSSIDSTSSSSSSLTSSPPHTNFSNSNAQIKNKERYYNSTQASSSSTPEDMHSGSGSGLIELSDSTKQAIAEQKKCYETFSDKVKQLTDITNALWKANTSVLDFSNQNLGTINDFANYCKDDIPSEPPLFPYKQITRIILKNNKLQKLCGIWLSPCIDLRYLDVSHNEIKKIDLGELFNACPRLKYFDGSHNKSPKMMWSQHKPWQPLQGGYHNKQSMPIILLAGNGINTSDQEWLKNRYNEELKQLAFTARRNASVFLGTTLGAIIPTPISIPVGCIMQNPYLALMHPIGAVVGSLIGCGIMYCYAESAASKYAKRTTIPLYFDEQQISDESISNREKPVAGCL